MKYALEILMKDKELLEECLKGFNKFDYIEAFKNREKKINQLNRAINLLKKHTL